MGQEIRCRCPRCTIRGLMGPAVLITVGVLFLLHEVRGEFFDFSNTWPFLLIVIGGVLLASSMAPMTGHVEPVYTPPTGVPPPTPGATPRPTQTPMPGQGH